jgi:hypothetical protein
MPTQTPPQQLLSSQLESRSLELLVPELRAKVETLSRLCLAKGFELGIGCTVRGPEAQARLWCRSKTPEDVARRRDIVSKSAPLIASLLREEYCSLSPPGSTHLPGSSWHQWGEALDVYAKVKGMAIWEGHMQHLIADLAKQVGLFHSWNEKQWDPKSRHWHAQLRKFETPLMLRGMCDSLADVEREMLARFEF